MILLGRGVAAESVVAHTAAAMVIFAQSRSAGCPVNWKLVTTVGVFFVGGANSHVETARRFHCLLGPWIVRFVVALRIRHVVLGCQNIPSQTIE